MLRLLVLIDKPMPQGNDGCLGAVGDAELGEDPAHIIANCAFREKQACGDICVGLSVGEQAQDLLFTGAERLGNRRVMDDGGPGDMGKQFPRDGRVHKGLPGGRALDGFDQPGARRPLEQIARGPGTDRVEHPFVSIIGG